MLRHQANHGFTPIIGPSQSLLHRTPAGMLVSGSRPMTTSPTRPGSARSSQVFSASASTLSRLDWLTKTLDTDESCTLNWPPG